MTRQIMVGFSLSSGFLVLTLLLGTGAQARDAAIALVNVEELKPQYESCGVVEFSVRNTSRQDVYVEVYAEDLEGDFWTNVALRDRLCTRSAPPTSPSPSLTSARLSGRGTGSGSPLRNSLKRR
jgi:hypothetical protein